MGAARSEPGRILQFPRAFPHPHTPWVRPGARPDGSGKYSSLTLASARDVDRSDPIAAKALPIGSDVVDDDAVVGMARGGAVRNRSEIVTVFTPRGPLRVVRQEVQGLKRRRSWTWFWRARREGRTD